MIKYYTDNVDELVLASLMIQFSDSYTINNIHKENVSLLGLKQAEWKIQNGRRSYRDYFYTYTDKNDVDVNGNTVEKSELAVRFRTEYSLSSDTFYKEVLNISTFIDFYKRDGQVGLSKQINKMYSPSRLNRINVEIRQNKIDWLIAQGKLLKQAANQFDEPIKNKLIDFSNRIEDMWLRYEREINHYVALASSEIKDVIENESDPIYNEALNTSNPIVNATMKQIILSTLTQ